MQVGQVQLLQILYGSPKNSLYLQLLDKAKFGLDSALNLMVLFKDKAGILTKFKFLMKLALNQQI